MVSDQSEIGGGERDMTAGESGRTGGDSDGSLICAFKGLGDAFAGAIMGSVFGFGAMPACGLKFIFVSHTHYSVSLLESGNKDRRSEGRLN